VSWFCNTKPAEAAYWHQWIPVCLNPWNMIAFHSWFGKLCQCSNAIMSHSGCFTGTFLLQICSLQIQSMCFWWVSVAAWLNLNESTRRVFWMLNVVCDVHCCGYSSCPWIGARGRAAIRCNINPAPPGVSMATCPHCLLVSFLSGVWVTAVLSCTDTNSSPEQGLCSLRSSAMILCFFPPA